MTAKTTSLDACAQRVRALEAELDAATADLRHALAEDGWAELLSHYAPGAPPAITYQRAAGGFDPLTGMPAGDVTIRTLDSFVRDGA